MDSKKLYSALYALTANKGFRHPSLAGVLFDKGSIVASNAFAMVVAKTEYPPEWEGKILDKAGKEINEKPMYYKGVLPYDPDRALRTSDYGKISDLDELREAMRMTPKSPDKDGERIGLEIEDSLFYVPLVQKVLSVFDVLGESIEVFVHTAGIGLQNRLIVLSENGGIGIVMPIIGIPDGPHPQKFTIEEALCADLL